MGRERLFGWLESDHLTVFRRNFSRTSALRIAAREARTKCTGLFFNRSARAESGETRGKREAESLGASRGERAAEAEATKVLSRSSASFPTFGTRRAEEEAERQTFLSTFNFVKFIPC